MSSQVTFVGGRTPLRKTAEAEFRIEFALRSSRTSLSSSVMPVGSSVVVPGRLPPSMSACRTRVRSASRLIPSCSATRVIAPPVAYWLRSSGSFLVPMGVNLPCYGSLHQTQGDSPGPDRRTSAHRHRLVAAPAHADPRRPCRDRRGPEMGTGRTRQSTRPARS